VAGIARLHQMIAEHMGQDVDHDAGPQQVRIETDRGPWAWALGAAGYSVYAVNLLRLHAWWNGHALDRTRTAHLARLELSLAAFKISHTVE
jgi:hypothetical protein